MRRRPPPRKHKAKIRRFLFHLQHLQIRPAQTQNAGTAEQHTHTHTHTRTHTVSAGSVTEERGPGPYHSGGEEGPGSGGY